MIFQWYKPLEKKVFHKVFVVNAAIMIFFGLSLIGLGIGIESMYDNYTLDNKILDRITMTRINGAQIVKEIGNSAELKAYSEGIENYLNDVDWYTEYSSNLPKFATDDRRRLIQQHCEMSLIILRDFNSPGALIFGYRLAKQANLLAGSEGYFADAFTNRSAEAGHTEPIWLQSLEPIFLLKLKRKVEAYDAKLRIVEQTQLKAEVLERQIGYYFGN